jgi:hypothetical protein
MSLAEVDVRGTIPVSPLTTVTPEIGRNDPSADEIKLDPVALAT